jgi:hypothetical protein
MPPVPLPIPPGIVLNRTKVEAQGRWVNCNHIRWGQDGQPEKIKGWTQWADDGDIVGPGCRSVRAWQDYNFRIWHTFGTYRKLYVFNHRGTLNNITPLMSSGNLTDPFSTGSGNFSVTVDDVAHGVVAGQSVFFSGASATGGITIDGEYIVDEVLDADSYVIIHSSAASSAVTGGGTVAYKYELAPGYLDLYYGGGWGIGRWGKGTWGTVRSNSSYTQLPRYWSLANYGQYLLALPSGGTLYEWENDTSTRAAAVSGAPTSGLYMFVTSERIVTILGADGEFMRIRTSDDDDYTTWTPASDNTCISRVLQKGNRMVAGASLSMQNNILWSDTHTYRMIWTGTNAVYATPDIAEIGLIGPAAFCTNEGVAYWMSNDAFHLYNGAIEPIPNWQDIEDIFDDLSVRQRSKVACWYNPSKREVWWHYPSTDATENDKYVMVDLSTWAWAVGTMDRTAWFVLRTVGEQTVIATDSEGFIYEHEDGLDDLDDALDWSIEAGWIDLQSGNIGINVDGYIPDFERWTGNVFVTIKTRDLPEDFSVLDTQTFEMSPGTDIQDIRMHGRHVKLTLSQTDVRDGDFALGAHKLEIGTTGIPRRD